MNSFLRILLVFFTAVFLSGNALADGTRQASPTNSADGASLLIAPDLTYGSYMGCANDNRIRFTILNATTENLYMGFQTRSYNTTASTTISTAYYRIYNAAGTLVAGPTLIPTSGAGFISTYAQAFAGPNIGGATPTGYNPITFDPATTGDFYIEIYRSDDGGNTMDASTNGRITMPFFDFTVSTTGNTQSIGRVWSRKWSFVTTNLSSGNFEQSIASSFTGDYYAYTPDHFIVQVQFQNGFRPLAYEVAMNFTGAANTGNFVNDRRSSSAVATLTNGYQVFLTTPDAAAFPGGVTGSPAFTSSMYGCPGAFFIPYYIDQAGDVGIVLDLNGTAGYQAGTADVELTAFGMTAGNHVMNWNGLNGLGAAVPANFSASVQITLYQGRTNLPMNDAEMNINGLTIISVSPSSGSKKLYWDDTNITPNGACAATGDNNNNVTTGGVFGTVLANGILGPTHAWNGSNPTTAVPAPASGGGNGTALLCDDYGNARCINTWFYAVDLSSPVVSMVLPNCDKDNDGIADNVDLDDDNDGVADLVENAGLPDATGDADSDGIPNYIDPSSAGFVDVNFDGVDDRYDFDRDGVINSFDLDSDNDGIPDLIENGQPDANTNAQIDGFVDLNGNGLSDPVDPACNNTLVFASATAGTTGTVTNTANSVDNQLNTFASLGASGALDIDLGATLPSGTVITVNLSSTTGGTAATGSVFYSTDDVTYTLINTYSDNTATANGTAINYTLPAAARYIRITRTTNAPRVHAVRYLACAGTIGTAITPINTDGTGGANYLDIDSDNDGITDNSEAQTTSGYIAPTGLDTDRDGLDNAYDTNNGGTAINPVNTDGTDNRDYMDLDSDNDGISDAIEGWDTDGDGNANTVATGVDTDGDGLDNAYDTNNSAVNPTNGTTPNSYPNVIISGTPERDWREVNPPKVTLTGTTTVLENSGTAVTLTATLSAPTGANTVITLTYSGTATNGTDYTASSTTITILAGATTGTVTVTPINDGTYEGNETVIATITSVTGGNGATIGSPAAATVTITDDEAVPTVSISGGTTIGENSGGSVTLTVTLSVPTTTATVVNLGYTGTATSGTDYASGVTSVTIPANSTTATLTITPTNDAVYEGNETVITTITSVSGGNGATIGTPASTTTTIVDDETVPTVSISGGTTIAENAGGSVTLTVTLSGPASTATVVNLGYTGTATSGTDYTAGVASVTIPANATTATLTITPTNDAVYEGNETVITTITSVTGGNGATIGTPVSTTTTIVDDEAVPTVSISGGTTIAENAGGSVTLTVTLSGTASTATVVNLGYTGTATSGTDYTAGVASVTIPANATTATLTITPINDGTYEGNETVITTITSVSGGNGATIGTPSSTTTIIADDETVPTVSISGGTTIAENAPGTVTLTVTLSAPTTVATVVNLGYTGTATAGTDYVTGVTSVTIPANATTATLVIDPNDDAIYEGNETVITTITSVTGGNGATIGTPSSTTTTIVDNEAVPTVSISGGTTIGENSGGSVTLTVTLSGAASTATVVNLGYTGTATSGTDYTAGVASVTIPANATTATLTITPINDGTYEGNETVITTITSVTGGNGATIGTPASTTTTIVDDETVPTVSISGGTNIAENAGGSVTLTVTLSAPTTVATVVNLGYTGTATSGTDYTAGVASVTIPANSTTATLIITPINDGTYEGNETVITTITSVTGGNGATIGTPASTTTTIVDDETVPTVSISGGTTIAENAGGSVTLTVTLSAPTTVATVVNLGYTGTATSGTDYTAGVASVTIPANSTTATLTITPINDGTYEGNETVITTITSVSGGNGATIGTPSSTTTTIVDDETVPTVSISGGTTIAENSPGTVTLTVTLSAPTTVATVVNLGYTGTATSGTDYVTGVTSVTIPANATTATLVIDPNDDAVYEGNETVITTITSVTGGNGATIGTPASTTTTIVDNEAVPTVSISGGTTIGENSGGSVTLTVTLSGAASTATVVNLGYTGTATSGTDYTAGVASVTIPANSTTATLTITPINDGTYEGNETVITTITSVTGGNGATIGTPASTTTTIVDDETVPTVSISGGTNIAENAGGSVTLTVTLSAPTTVATVVNLGYTGTATSGTDYTAGVASVTIPANSTTATLIITPINDGTYEGNETVITTITSVTGGNGATIGTPASTTTTIVDDETVPTVSISGGTTIAENAPGTVTLTVTLSVPTTVATVVNLGYTGTATAGTDYVTGVASVTIPANATTATLVIDPNDDLIYEGNETVITTITSVSGGNSATIGSPASTTTTIVDNETVPTVTLSGTTTILENSGTVVTLTATLSSPTTVATVITLTNTGTATSGTDYTASSITITIPANSTTGTITIIPINDGIYEGTETVITTITSVTGGNGATIGSPAATTVTITDDEAVPTVSISGGTTIAENSPGTVTLTVTLSGPASTATVVNLGYTGTATSGTDYVAGLTSVTIPANATTATFVIDPNDDVIYEGNETVITTITSVTGGNGVTIGTPASTTTTIVDNETVPTVSISGGTTIAENSAGTVTLTVTLSGAASTATTVNLGYTGTATSGTDYVAGITSVTIPANATTATFVIDPNDDVIYEGNETVITTITSVSGGNGVTIGSPASTTTAIVDDETVPTVSISGGANILENSPGTVTLTVALSVATTVATTVNLGYTGTATSGVDYVAGVTSVTIPAGSTTATFVIDPNDDLIYEGDETVVVTITSISGGNGATIGSPASTTVTIVDNDNAAPVANDNAATTNEDVAVVIPAIQGNDTDSDGTVVTSTIDLDPATPGQQTTFTNAGGTWTVNTTTGNVTFTPAANFNGTASITYTINDNLGATSNAANLTVIVAPVNDAPIVDNETHTINEDTPATGDLTDAGDSDPDGTALTANTTPVVAPSNGTIVINTNGTYTYTPNANFNGTDMVVVSICDAGLPLPAICVNDTIFITVTPVNDAPIIDNEIVTINEDTPATGDLTDAGDSDPDGTPLTANTTPVVAPSNGTIVINANGTYTYTPNANFNGTDMVVVSICDAGLPLPAICVNDTIFITVTAVNDAPIVDNETHTINEDTPVSGDLTDAGDSDPDGTPLTANTTPVVAPSNGTIVINANGTYTYTPNANFNGTDMVVVSICDAGLPLPASCVNDTIFITVTAVNDAPIIDNEIVTINEDTPATGDLTDAGDSDPDGTPLTANTTPVVAPSNGTIVINANGTYTYTPNANFNGTDMVVVSICDAGLPLPASCVNDTIFITVTAVNDAPVVDNETHTINEDTPVSGDLTDTGDSDPEGTPLTVNTTPVVAPSNGTIVINTDGTYTYTPNANFNGTDMIVVSICDAGLPLPAVCVNDTIFITVTAVNDAPVVDNETHTINEDTPATGDLTNAGDFDPDGTTLTVNTTPVVAPSNGTIVINADGTYTYTPDANFSGTDTVVVSICDAGIPLPAICVNDTIFITVTPINDVPVIDNEYVSSINGNPVSGDLTDAGDFDVDGNLVVNTTPVSGPSNGTIVINPDGTYTYTPNNGFSGTDTIIVSICDDGNPLPVNCVNDTIFITIITCPSPVDSDNDGLTDCEESTGVNDPSTPATPNGTSDPNNPCSPIGLVTTDTDGDGLTDCEETTGTDDPSTPGVPNGTSNPNDPCDPNPMVDSDGDGLTNCEETTGVDNPATPAVPNGTSDPNNACSPIGLITADTDGDGLTDCEETTGVNDPSTPATPTGTSDPNNACSPIGLVTTDTDGDGLTDCEETTGVNDPSTPATPTGTSDPNNACSPIGLVTTDTDGDGLTDCEETTGVDDPSTPSVPNGTSNPNDPCDPKPCGIDIPDAFTPDGDGMNDVFVIEGIEKFPNNTLTIFNRWGYEVYAADVYDNTWGGNSTSNLNVGGDQLPTGTYYYLFDTGTTEYGVLKGYIYLKR